MEEDSLVRLGEAIGGRLVGCTPEEFMLFRDIVRDHGLRYALNLAQAVVNSPSVSPGKRQAWKTIFQVCRKYRRELAQLTPEDVVRVVGYAYRALWARRILADPALYGRD